MNAMCSNNFWKTSFKNMLPKAYFHWGSTIKNQGPRKSKKPVGAQSPESLKNWPQYSKICVFIAFTLQFSKASGCPGTHVTHAYEVPVKNYVHQDLSTGGKRAVRPSPVEGLLVERQFGAKVKCSTKVILWAPIWIWIPKWTWKISFYCKIFI